MEKRSYLFGLGSGIVVMLFITMVPVVESAIPPTKAFPIIEVFTGDWAGQDTLVESETYNDQVHYVSDGSIIFNVTTTPPP